MRQALLVLCVAACGGPTTTTFKPRVATPDQGDTTPAVLADESNYKPSYGKADLEQALIAERGKQATAERVITELEARGAELSDDQMRTAVADLGVMRRFIESLEACQDSGRTCPPRLDEPGWTFDYAADKPPPPPLDAPLRYDLADWRKVAAELHGRACACRTLACVDSVGVAIDQVEGGPMPDVRGDETASQSITWARECLYRLRGKAAVVSAQHPVVEP